MKVREIAAIVFVYCAQWVGAAVLGIRLVIWRLRGFFR